MIKTSNEGTNYCDQCEIYARDIERLRTIIKSIGDTDTVVVGNFVKLQNKLFRIYDAADAMAEVCTDLAKRLKYWDEKARE